MMMLIICWLGLVGAGLNDVTLGPKTGASKGYLNGTYQEFDLGTAYPWGLSVGGDSNYAGIYSIHPPASCFCQNKKQHTDGLFYLSFFLFCFSNKEGGELGWGMMRANFGGWLHRMGIRQHQCGPRYRWRGRGILFR